MMGSAWRLHPSHVIWVFGQALGRTIGIAQCYVSQLERGERNLSLAQLEKIAQALHCSVLDLMDPERKVA